MGGNIRVESKLGVGTTFFIELSTRVKVPKKELYKFDIQNQYDNNSFGSDE